MCKMWFYILLIVSSLSVKLLSRIPSLTDDRLHGDTCSELRLCNLTNDIFFNRLYPFVCLFVCLVVFNATFNNISVISWRSVLLVEEPGGREENHRPVASPWQTLSHNVVQLALSGIRTQNISGDSQRLHR